MFKLYKNLKARDWIGVGIVLGLTFVQVWCTMSIVDYIKNVIQSIMYVNYHNNPALINESVASMVGSMGWDGVMSVAKTMNIIPAEMLDMLALIATASVADIWKNAGMMVAFAGFMIIVQALISITASFVSADLSTNIRSKVYDRIQSFSLAEISKFSASSLITRTTNDIQHVQFTNVMMMRMVFAAPVTAVWAIVKIKASSAELTLATAISIVLLLIFLIIMMILVLPKFKIVQKLIDRLNGVARENLTGIRIIRAFNAESYQTDKFENANENLTKTQIFTGQVMALLGPVMTIIMNGIILAISWLGAGLINKGTLDYATVVAFSNLSSQIIMSFMMLMFMFILWPRASVCANRINEVLETKSTIMDPEQEIDVKEKGTIEFKAVNFRYPDGDDYALHDINFKVEKGQTVAIIGSTGSGKTSIVNLIPRFYDVTEGEVLVDGVNVKNLKQDTLRSLIGYVPQKGFLFKGSISSNVALGLDEKGLDEKALKERIEEACKVAEAEEFIKEKQEGYDFEIAQGGKNVSGGQRQRLCIARAVAKHPEIYIFDDSFSALDYKTDKKVRTNLSAMKDGSARLIVAQRIGTIMEADNILVVNEGRIVGSGTHKELLANCPTYREIALSQLSKEELGL